MVYLESLQMQNIRSIGDTPHSIEFLRPLTLIQGNNGTGKTTVIEALNYVTSNSLPAGKLTSFIHDPKVAQKKKVDARIILKFKNIKGEFAIATRRMNAVISNTIAGISTKSDESTYKIISGDDTTSKSTKVGDFHQAVIDDLGVSKAILENVIFCHQEESNWPLCEPKKLKEKFDEIFEVSDYVTVMDHIKSEKKRLEIELIRLDSELPHIEKNVEQYCELEKEYNKRKKKHKLMTEERDNLAVKLKDWEAQEKKLSSEYLALKTLSENHKLNKVKLVEKKSELARIKIHDYAGTQEDLEDELSKAQTAPDVLEAGKKQAEIDAELASLERDLKRIEVEIPRIQDKLNKIKVAEQVLRNTEEELAELVEKLKKEYKFSGNDVEGELKRLISDVKNEREQLELESRRNKTKLQAVSDGFNKDVNKLEVQKTAKLEDVARLESEIRKIDNELKKVGDPAIRAAAIESRITVLETELETAKSVEELEADLDAKTKQLADSKIEIEVIERFLAAEVEWKAKKKLFDTEYDAKRADFDELFGEKIGKNFTDEIEMLKTNLDSDYRKSNFVFEKVDKDMTKLENDFKELSMSINYTEKLVSDKQETISRAGLDASQVKKEKVNVTSQLHEKRSELGQQQGCSFLYSKWEKDIDTKKCCPLCDRGYEKVEQVKKLSEKVQRMNKDLPDEIKMLEKRVAQLAEKEEKLLQILPLVEEIENLAVDLTEKKDTLKDKEEVKENKTKEWKEARKQLDDVQKKKQKASVLLGDAKNLDNLLKMLRNAEKIYLSEKDKVTAALNIESADFDVGTLKNKMDRLESSKESLTEMLTTLKDKLNVVKSSASELFKLKEEKLKLGEFASMSRSREEKSADLNNKKLEARNVDALLPDLKDKLKNAENALQVANLEAEDAIKKISNKVHELERRESEVRRIKLKLESQDVDKDSHKQLIRQLEDFTSKKDQNETKKRRLEAERSNALSKQEQIRVLQDQLRKMDLAKEILSVQKECEQFDAVNYESVKDELVKVQRKRQADNDAYRSIDGSFKELDEDLALRKREFKKLGTGSDMQYRDKMAQKLVFEQVVKDLDLFNKSLDDAIISYHKRKMESINMILEEHWPHVYKGTDIDTIKICSDAVSGNEKKKSYDYKVVMVVDGKELEMRDRCSAGQKVLASILIRVALADVFATGCPVLALDEPTTNLDRDKVESVAEMLEDLLKLRGNNLQLIVITHDVEFVSRLYRACSPEYYYGLSKNEYGVSVLKRHTRLGATIEVEG